MVPEMVKVPVEGELGALGELGAGVEFFETVPQPPSMKVRKRTASGIARLE
jgi:hypothetical protein